MEQRFEIDQFQRIAIENQIQVVVVAGYQYHFVADQFLIAIVIDNQIQVVVVVGYQFRFVVDLFLIAIATCLILTLSIYNKCYFPVTSGMAKIISEKFLDMINIFNWVKQKNEIADTT
ncbi:hypothetical protein BpHYR1_007688 [Brachionus plicatilis]|uniref:Uncharacterized protein n=1 Tax=Brachionus plicatilis TaxID=10195 RepID=A0A3M7SPT9_BRAPC|nr:hypothetical protein BpHYR1_007688 [Brachionus plicatilis]